MASLKLWYSPGACSLAPHILLEEAGLKYDTQPINVRFGVPADSPLRKINPKGQVPVLEMDDQVITEVPAILTAISQLVPDRHFLGRSNIEIVRSYEWMNWLSGTMHRQSWGSVFRPGRYSDDETMHGAIKQKGMSSVLECFDAVEQRLTGLHAVGDDFTAVDAYLFVYWRWGALMSSADMASKYPKYTKLVEELLKRDSVQSAMKAEGINENKL